MSYHEPGDHRFSKSIQQGAPHAFKRFVDFDQAVFDPQQGTLPVKVRELVAIGIALTTQCPYCIEAHTDGAKRAGATGEEIADVVMVAAALRAGAGFTHGWMAMKHFEKSN